MAYRRTHQTDIRSIHFRSDTASVADGAASKQAPTALADDLPQPKVWAQTRRVLLMAVALLALLGASFYLEIRYGWVLPLADKLLSLGR